MIAENKKKITFKADDLKYPTAEEIKFADSVCPKFTNFGFADNSVIISILDGKPMKDASNEDNLFWWDLVLINRFGSLRGAYYETLTHYRRGFKDDYRECSDHEMINRILFDSNAEIFYYFYFVTSDVIAQIMNLYFQCNLDEDKVAFNQKLFRKVSNIGVKQVIIKFHSETSLARQYRNRFTHKFPVNYPDYRSQIHTNEGKTVLYGGSGTFVSPTKLLNNIETSMKCLSIFMTELKLYIQVPVKSDSLIR